MYEILQDVVKISITMSGIVLNIMSDIVLKNDKAEEGPRFFLLQNLAKRCWVWYNCHMKLTDMHTHSTFSADGKSPLADMVSAAKNLGLSFYGISEHFDTDSVSSSIFTLTDIPAYFSAARALQAEVCTQEFRFLAGGEYGFSREQEAQDKLLSISADFRPDFVINSVHAVDGHDCYFPDYFAGKTKEAAYGAYLEMVRDSLDAPYAYDIVGHIGYVSRNAPYPVRKIRYDDFPDLYDDILKTIVRKGKILEVNSSARGAECEFLPDVDVLARYFSLGGRLISFGSDAHATVRICEKRELVISALKKIGFTAIAVPVCGEAVLCDFD